MPRKRNRSSDSYSSASENECVDSKKKPSKNVPVSSESSSSDDDDGEWNAKPKSKSKSKRNKGATKKPAKVSKKKIRTAVSDDDKNCEVENNFEKNGSEKEEGEVDFSDDENEEFNDGYDENLMGDEEDQRKLSEMTEKEREQELFNRGEKREVLKTRFEIEKKLRLAKKQEMKQEMKKKTGTEKPIEKSADTSYTDSAVRSIERRRNMEDKRKVKDAMKGLKAEREKKKEKLKQKLKATDVYSDSSESEESNSEIKVSKRGTKKSSTSEEDSSSSSIDSDFETKIKSDSRKRSTESGKERPDNQAARNEQFDFNIEHLNSLRISRFKMEKWCHAPFFKDTVINSFVRIGVGTSSISQYIVGQIVDVVETPKIYLLGKTRTNKGIKLKHGKNLEKVFRLEYVSNSEFSPTEFEQWQAKMVAEKCDFPNKDLVESKKADIQKAINYNYSEEDIELIVAEKERFKDKPINFAMKKTELIKEKEFAEMNGDHDKASEISKEIDRLEEESKKLDKVRTQSIAPISFINERNRMRNIKEAERAIAEAAKEAQNNKDDPFTRRKCTPSMIHVFNKNKQKTLNQQESGSANDNENNQMNEMKNESNSDKNVQLNDFNEQGTSSNLNNVTNKSSKANESTPQDANDMFSVHDFDIKIDFNNLSGLSNANSSTISSQNSSFSNSFLSISNSNGFSNARSNPMAMSGHTNRRSLNLDEYKKKKGLI